MRQAEHKRLSFLFIVNRGAGEVRGPAAAKAGSQPDSGKTFRYHILEVVL